MNRNEILEKLQVIIREAVDDDEVVINENTIASDVDGWDSLANVLILGEIQNEMGVKFTSSEVKDLANIGQLVDAIVAKQ